MRFFAFGCLLVPSQKTYLFFKYLIHLTKNIKKCDFLKSTDEAHNFRIKKLTSNIFGGINKLSNAKNHNILASKLRPVKTFKSEKMLLCRRGGNSTTDGWSYI